MSLKLVSRRDLFSFWNAHNTRISGTRIELAMASLVYGLWGYYRRFDKLILPTWVEDSSPFNNFGLALVDGKFLDTTASGWDQTRITGGYKIATVGTFDPDTGNQRLYFANDEDSYDELDPDDLTLSGTDVYPNTGPMRTGNGTLGASDPGFYNLGGGDTYSPAQIFEELTDGVVGETETTGTNVFPDGLMLTWARIAYGYPSGDPLHKTWVWIDIANGRCVGRFLIPGHAGIGAAPGREPRLDGEDVLWQRGQFVPDDDSTITEPKGFMFITAYPQQNASPILERLWMRFIDLNPMNKTAASGTPSRTHARITLTSRIEFDEDLSNYSEFPLGPTLTIANYYPIYHPPTADILLVTGAWDATYPTTGDDKQVRFSYVPHAQIDLVSPVTALSVPRTADTVTLRADVRGDFQEPIAGVAGTWTLKRQSTLGEVLDASTFPGSSQLAQFPVDPNDAGDAEGTLVVTADGTPLVETTDYTVNLTTGLITWVTDQSGAALVTADYEHRGDPVTPAHGTLLSSSGNSDANGQLWTRVRYDDDDDLVGQIDIATALVDDSQ